MSRKNRNTQQKYNVLVTGATGFLGQHLCLKLLNERKIVYALVRDTLQKDKLLKIYPSLIPLSLDELFSENCDIIFDTIYHTAAWHGLEHRQSDIDEIIGANLLLGTKLLEHLSNQRSNNSHFIYCLTYWQFATGSENYEPNSLYAASKQAFHNLVVYYSSHLNIKCAGVVLFDNYAPKDSRKKLLNSLARKIVEYKKTGNSNPIALTPGEQEIYFCHVEDACDALIAADSNLPLSAKMHHVFFARKKEVNTLKKTVESLIQSYCKPSDVVVWAKKSYPRGQVMKLVWGEPVPGWSPKYDLAEEFNQMVISNDD